MIGKISVANSIDSKMKALVLEFPEIGDYAVAAISSETRDLIMKNYMSGQVLNLSDDDKSPFYKRKKSGAYAVYGSLFNLFENGKKVISNLSGHPVDTGLIDKREILKPAALEMSSRVDSVLDKVLKKQKTLKGVLS